MLPLPGLSPVAGKDVVIKFDGGRLSSDGGILTCARSRGAFASLSAWPPASRTHALPSTSRIRWPTSFASVVDDRGGL